jgi:hypothetical protein
MRLRPISLPRWGCWRTISSIRRWMPANSSACVPATHGDQRRDEGPHVAGVRVLYPTLYGPQHPMAFPPLEPAIRPSSRASRAMIWPRFTSGGSARIPPASSWSAIPRWPKSPNCWKRASAPGKRRTRPGQELRGAGSRPEAAHHPDRPARFLNPSS